MTTMSPFESVGARHFSTQSSERGGVDRSVEGPLRHGAGKAQASDKRDRFVMAVGNGGAQPSAAPTASAFARHVRGGPGLVDEHQLRRIEVELPREPSLALRQNVGASLFLGMPPSRFALEITRSHGGFAAHRPSTSDVSSVLASSMTMWLRNSAKSGDPGWQARPAACPRD
jgi:hypothetical protein